MMIKLKIKYLNDEEIVVRALQFLDKYNNQKIIPVPIEELIDLEFDINIIPLPGIQQLCDVEGFSAPDFSAIYVDKYVYENRFYRYRYTLAHELGHWFIHKDKLKAVKLDKNDIINSWIHFNNELDPADHSKMEYQGYTFGGLIMAPPENLRIEFENNIPSVVPMIEEAKQNGIPRNSYLNYAIDRMASTLSSIFDASIDVLIRRIKFDSLQNLLP